MLVVETIAKIRRLSLVQGKTMKLIMKDGRIHKNTLPA
jgi:hypothetical protein